MKVEKKETRMYICLKCLRTQHYECMHTFTQLPHHLSDFQLERTKSPSSLPARGKVSHSGSLCIHLYIVLFCHCTIIDGNPVNAASPEEVFMQTLGPINREG